MSIFVFYFNISSRLHLWTCIILFRVSSLENYVLSRSDAARSIALILLSHFVTAVPWSPLFSSATLPFARSCLFEATSALTRSFRSSFLRDPFKIVLAISFFNLLCNAKLTRIISKNLRNSRMREIVFYLCLNCNIERMKNMLTFHYKRVQQFSGTMGNIM